MKQLEEFMLEYRTKKTPLPTEEIKDKSGHTVAEVNPKVDDSVIDEETDMDEEEMGENESLIQERFDMEKPFFVLGHAGWGKTSIIERVAKRNGYEIVIVYLDKAVKEDLGGMPIVQDDPEIKGEKTTKMVPPSWAKKIIYNQDKQFLLFFDEMNQADPEVMNALMPIVLEGEICGKTYKNFIVGAAGNYKSENKATHELSGPLLSRFKPLIIWEDNTEGAWDSVFKYLHKKYDSILGADLINAFAAYRSLFDNPRELEHKVFDPYIKIKKKGLGTSKRYSPERISRYLLGGKGENGEDRLIKKDVDDADAKKYCNEMAELIYDWLTEGTAKKAETSGEGEESGRRRGSSELSMPENVRNMLENGIRLGYIDGRTIDDSFKDTLFIVAEDNIYDIFDPAEVNAESIKHLIKHLAGNGTKFKYKTVEEGIKDNRGGTAKRLNPVEVFNK